jgi:hypothetical protein
MKRCSHPDRVVSLTESGRMLVSCADCGAHGLTGTDEYPRREWCPTCSKARDDTGRLPIGFCGKTCLMAKVREQRLAGRTATV